MKKCSTSLVIKEMQIKITLRFYLPEIGMEKFMDKKNKKC
jgi:hypothetical protein